jgi:dihydrofolate reductase
MNMAKLIVSEWMSLDGVFDAETMGEWWAPYDSEERAARIQDTIGSAGAFVLGRQTYEMLAPYWSAFENDEMGVAKKLNGAPKYVVSSSLQSGSWNNTTIIKGEAGKELAKLKQQAGKDLLLMGSATLAHSLMKDGLIDEYQLLVTPIVMGRGRRFFEPGGGVKLTLTTSKALSSGVIALTYRPVAR